LMPNPATERTLNDVSLPQPQPALDRPAHESDDKLSFDTIYDRYAEFVWRSARRLGLDEATAEDALQEVFVVVHRRLGDFEGRSSLKTWLFGIVLGVVRNQKRALQRKRIDASERAANVLEQLQANVADQPDAQAERARAVQLLYALLDKLDDEKREVFVMAELEQMRGTEIAAATDTNLNTVYGRLKAARAEFNQAVSQWRARAAFGEQRAGRKP